MTDPSIDTLAETVRRALPDKNTHQLRHDALDALVARAKEAEADLAHQTREFVALRAGEGEKRWHDEAMRLNAETKVLRARVAELEEALQEILSVSDGMGGTKYEWEERICRIARAALDRETT